MIMMMMTMPTLDFAVSAFHASLTGEGYDKDDYDERAWLLTLLVVIGLRRYIFSASCQRYFSLLVFECDQNQWISWH